MLEQLNLFLRYARDLSGARVASFFRYEPGRDELCLEASSLPRRPQASRRFRLGEGLAGLAAERGLAAMSRDPEGDPRFDDRPEDRPSGAVFCMPISDSERLQGVLNLSWSQGQAPPNEDLLRYLGRSAAAYMRLGNQAPVGDRLSPEEQLASARSLQQTLVPRDGPVDRHLEVAAMYRSFQELGGDLLTVLPGKGRTLFAIADVCGHDLPAAMVTTMLRGLLRREARRRAAPGLVLESLDDTLTRELGPRWFATALVCELDHLAGVLRWAGAGHPSGLLWTPGSRQRLRLESAGPPLGFGQRSFPGNVVPAPPGSTVLLFSDGLSDLLDVDALTAGPAAASPARLRDRLEAALDDHRLQVHDDASALVARVLDPRD